MSVRTFQLTVALLASIPVAVPQDLLPWQDWVYEPIAEETRDLEGLLDGPWHNSGGPEGQLGMAQEPGPWGGKCLEFRVNIDHRNEGQYPMGWPSFQLLPDPPLDWSGFDALRYWVRCDTDRKGPLSLRFILWTAGAGRINDPIPGLRVGEWVQVTQQLRGVPSLDRVDRIHLFLEEAAYDHGDELTFRVGGLRLEKMRRRPSVLPAGQAALGLWVGERESRRKQVAIIGRGQKLIGAHLAFETGADIELRPSDQLDLRFHEVFSSRETATAMPLGHVVPEGTTDEVGLDLSTASLSPGYYLVLADILRDGQSLLGGRVGSDDLYVKAHGESMTFTVLSLRTGMTLWVRDLLHGDIMGATNIDLPHVYDPLNEDTYPEFVKRFAYETGKHTEGNEAGDTGLILAAEAFRKSGDEVRARFTEWLFEDSLAHMMDRMQGESGATITIANELADAGISVGSWGATQAFGSYDSNQIGEWMRPFAYAIIYYRDRPDKKELVARYNATCRRAADYLVAHSLQESDGLPNVVRHLHLNEKPDGTVEQITYHQEGRLCNVYLGRALAGLSYYAYAMQLLGDEVPDLWWQGLDNTAEWSARKMKPNGWFDWQCEDIVEGGCHTFLGNIYIGEGLFGCYLADKLAGRDDAAVRAAGATKKAYRYVTDDCYIKGTRFEYPTEFWVGPYVYWLFTEYLDTVGPDEQFEDWLTVLDRHWSVEREWRDFVGRPPVDGCYRSDSNGMLAVAILGYLAIKQMDEVGKPLHWGTT